MPDENSKPIVSTPGNQRYCFNQVLRDEIEVLRPGALSEFEASRFVDRKATSQEVADNKKTRSENLKTLFNAIGELPQGAKPREPLSALCFSGGGIRSATFNLGVLQGLARAGLLGEFDYLSSVSGGGYIASWVQAWMKREGKKSVIDQLAMQQEIANPLAPEPKPIDNLREYSNYLTPKLGLFSGDTWAAAAVILRNLILNWLVIVPLLAFVVAIPQLLVLVERTAGTAPQLGSLFLNAALIVALLASIATHLFRRFVKRPGIPQGYFIAFCVFPICLSASLLSTAALNLALPMKFVADPVDFIDFAQSQSALPRLREFTVLWCLLIPLTGWLISEGLFLIKLVMGKSDGVREFLRFAAWEFVGLVVSGLVAAALLAFMIEHWLSNLIYTPALYVICVLPLLLGVYLLARTLFVLFASAGEGFRNQFANISVADSDREWWGRLTGWILFVAVMWLALTGICIFLTDIVWLKDKLVTPAVAALGGVSGIATALLGKSGKTGPKSSGDVAAHSTLQEWALAAAAPTFAISVVLLVARGTALLGEAALHSGSLFATDQIWYWSSLTLDVPARFALYVVAGTLAFSLLFGFLVHVNRFSLHGFYRNRLVRAYLGASDRNRKPDSFTGLSGKDNIQLSELHPNKPSELGQGVPQSGKSRPPIAIVNVALNLTTGGDKLAWQQRKAESFSMTPLYCGNFHEGYRPTETYGGQGGISLGTAVTISGAAANPNMGYHSSPAISFLLALFNARLGAWLGNTNDDGRRTCKTSGPLHALGPLLSELFGLADARSRYVNLSDGGHFENLGLYEVVLRRCRHILVSDAGCDPECGFEDLGNAIRKIRIDFAIPIEFEKKIVIFSSASAQEGLYCATATIDYSKVDGDGSPPGRLIYIKPTLRAKGAPLPYDIYGYSRFQKSFPHESTADQWFNESQFESYRVLGLHTIREITAGKTGLNWSAFDDEVKKYVDLSLSAAT